VLDNAHLMRLAGRFARRVRAWAAGNAVPVIDCTAGERKHLIAEEYLRTHSVGPGVFVVLVSGAPAMVWDVRRSADGAVVGNLARKRTYVNHYSFHIMDRQWGHLTIKMAGHAPFGAQVLLYGHKGSTPGSGESPFRIADRPGVHSVSATARKIATRGPDQGEGLSRVRSDDALPPPGSPPRVLSRRSPPRSPARRAPPSRRLAARWPTSSMSRPAEPGRSSPWRGPTCRA